MKTIYKNIEDSRSAYLEYVNNHISNVKKAFNLFGEDIIKFLLHSYYTDEFIMGGNLKKGSLPQTCFRKTLKRSRGKPLLLNCQ